MSNESSKQPKGYGVTIDADAFDPIPPNKFKYGGNEYPALHFQQLRVDVQERIVRTEAHLAKMTVAKARPFLVGIIRAYVPDIPAGSLEIEPFEKLYRMVVGLTFPEGATEARPTTARRKSASRRAAAK